jgi:hypothetical protein
MDRLAQQDRHLANLRQWRGRSAPDLSLSFVKAFFKQRVERPHKQIGKLAELWREQVPAELVSLTALRSFRRGVLHVQVDHAAARYKLDRALRSGLQRQLQETFGATLKRIKVTVQPIETDAETPGPSGRR